MFFVAKLRCFQLFYTGKSLSACLQQITLILAFSLKKTFLLFCPSLWLFFLYRENVFCLLQLITLIVVISYSNKCFYFVLAK